MIEIINKEECCGCYACFNACPANAILMQEDNKGFKYPIIDKEKCINCGLCSKVCPIKNSIELKNNIKAYACINKDEKIRANSSSGGIFSAIASEIFNLKGVVFGAGFDEIFQVKHMCVKNINELDKLRCSKYVQSEIGNSYAEAREFLERGITVLFTGTPCQIEGLKAYLQKDYLNLYTQDIICHGVPSPKVWRKYLEERKSIDKKSPKFINFRNKETGWKLLNLKFEYNDNSYFSESSDKNPYMQAFFRNTILRDSCYNCSFKKINRNSDITLADFWGIENILPEFDDNKGTSLVILNSNKRGTII